MSNGFRERLLARESLFGTIVTLTTPQAAEALAAAGHDWLWIDMEHGAFDLPTVQSLIIATEAAAGASQRATERKTQCAAIVRVPANDETWLKRVLDLGPEGVIVPHVDSAEEARAAVRACRYPPRGNRSVGIGRAQGYGAGLSDALASAHERLAVMPQIESAAAVDEIDEILKVDGVDCAVVGPFDLSASLGHIGELDHPDVVAAMRRVAKACSKAGKPAGLFAGSVGFAKQWRSEGFSVIAVGADAALLSNAAAVQLCELRS